MDLFQGQELAIKQPLTISLTEPPSIGSARSYLRLESGGEIGPAGEEEEMSYGLRVKELITVDMGGVLWTDGTFEKASGTCTNRTDLTALLLQV
jgi:hypothetical protein